MFIVTVEHSHGLILNEVEALANRGRNRDCSKNRMGDASVVSRTGKMASRRNCGEWAELCEMLMVVLGMEERKNKKCGANKSGK